ncbi:MAG: hypothetical protein HYX90_02545, partial [Chloroflexi bacterium]|nr:hypothetical protein [Chloroflexota bacterium]
ASPTAQATSTASTSAISFAGKTITIINPAAAGGGNDIMARVYARYLPDFLPGKPTIIVRSMPGGGGTIGMNYVYLSAKPDGLTLLLAAGSYQAAQLLRMAGVKYDMVKMPAVVTTTTNNIFAVRAGTASTPEELVKAKGVNFGLGAGNSQPLVALELLGVPLEKVITGYVSAADRHRGFLSGEVNLNWATSPSYLGTLAPEAEKGGIVPTLQSGAINAKGEEAPSPSFPNLMTVSALYQKVYSKPPSGSAWEAYRALTSVVCSSDKALVLPPGTPDNIVRIYWDAAEKMMKNLDFIKMAENVAGKDNIKGGEQFDKDLKANFKMDQATYEWVRTTFTKWQIVLD